MNISQNSDINASQALSKNNKPGGIQLKAHTEMEIQEECSIERETEENQPIESHRALINKSIDPDDEIKVPEPKPV